MARSKFARTATGVPALAALALAIAACSPQHPGAAATVGNTRVSVTALNTAVAVAVTTPDTTTGQLPDRSTAVQSSLTEIIDEQLITDGAKAKGVIPTGTQVEAFLAQARLSSGSDAATAAQNNLPLTELRSAAYRRVLLNNLIAAVAPGVTDATAQNTAVTAYLATIVKQEGVSVNPRYGAWDAAHFDVVGSDAFASPLAAPASAPTG